METYEDALYAVKRGFLIIGLTGYTGSGCTTARRLLERKDRPQIPACYNENFSRNEGTLGRRRYEKLVNIWPTIPWEPFVSIEISRVIFAFAVKAALYSDEYMSDNNLSIVRDLAHPHKQDLTGLRFLDQNSKLEHGDAEQLIKAYEWCAHNYHHFKAKGSHKAGSFLTLMQNWGDSIRQFGSVGPSKSISVNPRYMACLPEAIRKIIKAYRVKRRSRWFCIDAFRTPFEVEFFRRRYSEFYLVCILRGDRERRQSLRLRDEEMKSLEDRERGKLIKDKTRDNINEWVTSQTIEECAQKADFFIDNVQDERKTYPHMRYHLVRLLALTQKPGCVPPTGDERAMQFAMTARQMSGCISRQVGAAVIGQSGYVLGIGWNDPPEGQVPCALRTGSELISAVECSGGTAFSEYELSSEFVSHISNNTSVNDAYCFKDEYPACAKKPKEKEYTRALHAEENAFLQIAKNGGLSLIGSTLYTTASTCILCAKKSVQLGVKRIVYIEEYPGIAIEHTLKFGNPDERINVDPFEGATGSAYFRLFSPILPEKDMIHLYADRPVQNAVLERRSD